jgi:transposase-like protein
VKRKEGKYYTPEFRRMALERMKNSSSISALAKELGIPRRRLYDWREALETHPGTEAWTPPDREKLSLRKQLQQTQQLLAKKTLEVDFFKGALQKIEARRQNNEPSGGTASTSKSRR